MLLFCPELFSRLLGLIVRIIHLYQLLNVVIDIHVLELQTVHTLTGFLRLQVIKQVIKLKSAVIHFSTCI